MAEIRDPRYEHVCKRGKAETNNEVLEAGRPLLSQIRSTGDFVMPIKL
jgi:hypothetical protein